MDTITEFLPYVIAALAVAVVLFGLDTFHRGPHR